MKILAIPIGVEGAIAYVVRAPSGAWLAIDAAEEKTMRLAANAGQPDYLILTHEHYDHIAGFGMDANAFADMPLVAASVCAELLPDPVRNLSKYDRRGKVLSIRKPDILVPPEGLSLHWQGLVIEMTPAPGHSPGGILIYLEGNLFYGDTLLRDYKTVTKLPGGNRNDLAETLRRLFERYPPDTRVWPGHGPSFLLKETSFERAMNSGL